MCARLVAFGQTPRLRALEPQAGAVFWNADGPLRPGKGFSGTDPHLGFLEWVLHDYVPPHGKGTLLGGFADRAVGLGLHEEMLLFAALLTPVRSFEVTEVLGPRGFVARDLVAGGEFRVGPLGLEQLPIRSDILICRLLPVGRLMRPGMSLLALPGTGREELLVYLRTAYQLARPARHVSLEDFLDRSVHLHQHFFLLRGRELGGRVQETIRRAAFAPASVSYAALELKRIRASLDRQPGLERQPSSAEESRYVVMDPGVAIPRATVALTPGGLTVQAETREDLVAARRIVETSLRGLIQPVGEMEERGGAGPTSSDPADVERVRGGAGFLAQMLDRWADVPAPAIGDRSPRQASASPNGREEVAALLLGLERDLARLKRLGRPAGDLTGVREALELWPAPAAPERRRPVRPARRMRRPGS